MGSPFQTGSGRGRSSRVGARSNSPAVFAKSVTTGRLGNGPADRRAPGRRLPRNGCGPLPDSGGRSGRENNMKPRITVLRLASMFLLTGIPALRAATLEVPIEFAAELESLEPVPLPGIEITIRRGAAGDSGSVLEAGFKKGGKERRFLAFSTQPRTEVLSAFRALVFEYTLSQAEGMAVRPAVMLYEKGGGTWIRTGPEAIPTAEFSEARMGLTSLREAAFSRDSSRALEWEQVERIWLGFVIDGTGAGAVKMRRIQLTTEPYRPSRPVPLLLADPAKWTVGADPAVKKSKESVTTEDGAAGVRFSFRFPGGRHMYFTPTQPVRGLEYSAYTGLRVTYKARVPSGIKGLLVLLTEEGGGSFYADPPPAATDKWETVDIPFKDLKFATWSRDADQVFAVDRFRSLCVGAHGVASGTGGDGEIIIRRIEVVP